VIVDVYSALLSLYEIHPSIDLSQLKSEFFNANLTFAKFQIYTSYLQLSTIFRPFSSKTHPFDRTQFSEQACGLKEQGHYQKTQPSLKSLTVKLEAFAL